MAKKKQQERIIFEDNRLIPVLLGEQNAHLSKIEDALDLEITSRGNEVIIEGDSDPVEQARQILESLWSQVQKGQIIDIQNVDSALRFIKEAQESASPQADGTSGNLDALENAKVTIQTKKKTIQPRSPRQAAYIEALHSRNMIFGIGPAGTGKTYLAVAKAAAMLEQGQVERIILSRPAVEAGERLGFLPGEMKEKMDPYMRPLYDALYDTMGAEKVQKKIASEEIEIAPLAFMRGRTLNNACIILDEAQNTTTIQMLMFLTRMGMNSKMVITGDPTQRDLPGQQMSGLVEAMDILTNIDDIGFVEFSEKDVVRHSLVSRIVKAYDERKKYKPAD